MTTNKNKELIGYDPLAWLGLETDASENSEEQLALEEAEEAQLLAESGIEPLEELTGGDGVEASSMALPVDESLSLEVQVDEDNAELIEDYLEAVADNVGTNEFDTYLLETGAVAVGGGDENNDLDSTMTEQELSPMVDLDATLTIQHVGELHEKLKLCLALHDEIEINASDVSAIDTASLQLLVALKKDAANLNKQVNIIYPSPRFVESAQLLGLLEILEVAV